MMKPFAPRACARALALTILLSSTALPALAQIELTTLSLTARAYDQIVNWQERDWRPAGLTEIVAVPGHILLDVRLVADGPWSDSIDRVQANSRDIRLVLPDGTELEPEGGFQYWGQLNMTARSFSGRRPRNFPTEDADIHWNGLFIVPEGTSNATLRIGGDAVSLEGSVMVPKTSEPEDAADFATFQVNSVRRFRVAQLLDGFGDDAVPSTITATPGMVMADIEIEVTGTATNQTDGDERFTWATHNFRLVDAGGQTLPLVGERFSRRILDWQFNGVDVGASAERNVVWLVPEGLAEARLWFGETEVGSVPLGGAPVSDTD